MTTHLIDGTTLNAYALNAYEGKGDFTHLIDRTNLNSYKGKGDSTHLIDRTTLNAYDSKHL